MGLTEITLDFETYYSKAEKYFLKHKNSGLTIEEYIRNPKFEVIGLSVKIGNRPTEWLCPHEIEDWIKHVEVAYGWDNVRAIAHNGRFDMAILGWVYNVYPGQIADTMLMSRACQLWDSHSLDSVTRELRENYGWGIERDNDGNTSYGVFSKEDYYRTLDKGDEVINADGKRLFDFSDDEYAAYAEYGKTDVDLTWSAYNWFMKEYNFPELEIEVMTATIETFTYPVVELHKPVLEVVKEEVNGKRQRLIDKVGATVEDLRSDVKFAELLTNLGVEPPTKLNAKGQVKYAFAKKDLAFLELLEHDNPDVVDLVEARLGNKSSQAVTRVERFLELATRNPMPIPLEYYAAHTGRWGGADSLNVQNMNRNQLVGKSTPVGTKVFYKDKADAVVKVLDDGKVQLARAGVVENDEEELHIMGLRDAIKAPKGKKLVVLDWSQIELRFNSWLWGEQWILDALVSGKDIYKVTAANTYGVKYEEVNKSQRFVGKSQQLGLGYGAGVNGLKVVMGKRSEEFTEEQLQSFVNSYRQSATNIKRGWDKCKNLLNAMIQGTDAPLNDSNELFYSCGDKIIRPNGLGLTYKNVHHRDGNIGKELWFWGKNKQTKKPDWEKTFGGKITENLCVDGEAEVLTDRGWLKLKDVRLTDRVHDGVEFTTHEGILYKSVKECVNIDGVYMTEDHEVLTNDGWKEARVLLSERSTSSIQRLDRTTLRKISCRRESALQKYLALVVQMRLRKRVQKRRFGREESVETRKCTELRMYLAAANKREEQNSRYGEAPYLCDMAFNEAALYTTESQGLAQLRWTWDNCLSTLARQFRELPRRYATFLSKRVGLRQNRQQWELRTNELSMGESQGELQKQTTYCMDRYAGRDKAECYGLLSKVWNRTYDGIISLITWGKNARVNGETRRYKEVYDILNCGPRNRFVVRGEKGPFIVHNCQAACRDIAAEKVVALRNKFFDRGWSKDDAHIVMTVHDEIIVCCKDELAEEVSDVMKDVMTHSTGWYSTLPLAVDGSIAQRYGCAK